jgi:hypothetical protein
MDLPPLVASGGAMAADPQTIVEAGYDAIARRDLA